MPQPRSSTASATASGSLQARTTIGVPGPLYLHAFSSRLSSNWPSSGRCARVQSGSAACPSKRRSAARSWPDQVRRWSVAQAARSSALQVGQAGLGVGPGKEQQRLDDPPEPDGVVVKPVKDALVLLDGARAAAGDLDRGDQGGQRGAELVRRLAGELPLSLERHVQAVEQPVEAAGEVLQLVAGPRAGQTAVVEGHGAGRLGHAGQRGEGAAAEMTADRRGQGPEPSEISGRMAASDRISASTGSSKAQAASTRAGRSRSGGEPLCSSRPGGRGRCSLPRASCGPPRWTSAADSPREHPPAQAVGPLDRRRDVHRERAEVAAVEDHRPPGDSGALDPPPRLVVDGPGHAAGLALGAIREAVQRRLQLLVQGEPQAQPGEVIEARGEPAEGQRQAPRGRRPRPA